MNPDPLQRPLELVKIQQIEPATTELDLPRSEYPSGWTVGDFKFIGPIRGVVGDFDGDVDRLLQAAVDGSYSVGDVTVDAKPVGEILKDDPVVVGAEPGWLELEELLGGELGPENFNWGALVGILEVKTPRLARIHSDRPLTRVFLGGQELEEGAVLDLPVGSWPIVFLAGNNRYADWMQLWLSPRLNDTTVEEVEAFNAKVKELREVAIECRDNFDDAVKDIVIDESTVVGKEGFVRVGKSVHGYWWFIDENNKPFFYNGVCAVNQHGIQGGRRQSVGYYTPVVEEKYKYSEGKQAFVDAKIAEIKNAGFNGLGSWTTEEFFETGMYITDILETNYAEPMMELFKFVDVFSPAWVKQINEKAQELHAKNKENKKIAGIYIENERGFPDVGAIPVDLLGNPILDAKVRPSVLQCCLAEKPEVAAHAAAWDFVIARHGSEAAAIKAWDHEDITSREDVRQYTLDGKLMAKGAMKADAYEFSKHFVDVWLRESAAAIRAADPNHLVLGVRWASPNGCKQFMEIEAKHCDVISINNYRQNLFERINEYGDIDKPFLNGEFSWCHDATMYIQEPDEPAMGWTVKDRMQKNGAADVLKAAMNRRLVGWTWYRFVSRNNEESYRNSGVVNGSDVEQVHNTNVHAEVNARNVFMRAAMDNANDEPAVLKDGKYTAVMNYAVLTSRQGVREPLAIGFEVSNGAVTSLTGYGVNGTAESISMDAGAVTLKAALSFTRTRFTRGKEDARYIITLSTMRMGHLTGRFKAEQRGEAFEGIISVWPREMYRNI